MGKITSWKLVSDQQTAIATVTEQEQYAEGEALNDTSRGGQKIQAPASRYFHETERLFADFLIPLCLTDLSRAPKASPSGLLHKAMQ